MTWASYADYLDWLQNLEIAAGYNLIGEIGHCKGGDAICIPGHPVFAMGNLGHDALDDAVNVAVAAPFSLGLSGADAAVALRAKAGFHGPHHTFWGTKMPHFQINVWLDGVKGSGFGIHIPWPW